MTFVFVKDPNSTLDYTIDWSRWLGSDVILSSEWTVDNGITKVAEANCSTTAVVWLSGGVIGKRYKATNRIETQGGRIDERTITIRIMER